MAAQPQPPQQPIYPDQLTMALDRLFLRITTFVNGQTDEIKTQMRVDRQEAIARDEALRRESLTRDNELRNDIKALADVVIVLTQKVSNIEATQQEMLKEMREGFAAQAERHNELMVRVERLERGNTPPATEA